MKIIRSIAGVPIRLTAERFGHIAKRHPEMADQQDRLLETVNQPDYVQEGDSGTLIAVKSYPKTPLSQKSCAVVYRELSDGDGFVFHKSSSRLEEDYMEAVKVFRKKRCASGLGLR